MRRIILAVSVVACLAVPTGMAVSTSSPAFAVSGITCKSVKGSPVGLIVIKGCVPKNKLNKTLNGNSVNPITGGTLPWAPSSGTTIVALTVGGGTVQGL